MQAKAQLEKPKSQGQTGSTQRSINHQKGFRTRCKHFLPDPKLRFMNPCREVMRFKRLALRTEQAHRSHWKLNVESSALSLFPHTSFVMAVPPISNLLFIRVIRTIRG